MTELYTPPDTEAAADAWGANCGPMSLAAALAVPVDDVRHAVSKVQPSHQRSLLGEPSATFPGYMGQGDLRRAVVTMGARFGREWEPFVPRSCNPIGPVLVMVNWSGPWDGTRGAPVYRHVIAYRRGERPLRECFGHVIDHPADRDLPLADRLVGPHLVYDCNVGWTGLQFWQEHIVPALMPKRGTGYRFTWGGEVLR